MELNHSDLEFILMNSYNKRLPLYIRGGIGIGKSYIIKKFAMKVAERENVKFVSWNDLTKSDKKTVMAHPDEYLAFIDMRALMLDLGDFKLPKFDENGGFEWCIPTVFKYLCSKNASAVLFLDEFNLAPQSIQGMFYSIINDRQIGENRLSDNVYVIAAGNVVEDRSAIYDMPHPLRNRFLHVKLLPPSVDDWITWALSANIDSRIISFLKFKPELLYKVGNVNDYAFPTPRSWERCSIGISNINDYNMIRMVAGVTVGEAAAIELVAHMKLTEKIDLDDILSKPEKVSQINDSQILFAIASGMVEKYKANKKNLKNIINVGNNMPPEYAIWMFRMIKALSRNWIDELVKATDIDDFDKRYGKFIA